MQIPSFMEKPPDDVQTAVADRSRRGLEMNFGAWDEEIGLGNTILEHSHISFVFVYHKHKSKKND